jgi:hypothetical protein
LQSNEVYAYRNTNSVYPNEKIISTRYLAMNGDEFVWFSLRQFDDIVVQYSTPLVISVSSSIASVISINVDGTI